MTHPKKEIAAAIKYAEDHGWRVVEGGGHAWGKMYCPNNDPGCRGGEFCKQSIWSTPKSAGNHARLIKKVVDNCTNQKPPESDSDDQSTHTKQPINRERP